jgi:hypothetical protein
LYIDRHSSGIGIFSSVFLSSALGDMLSKTFAARNAARIAAAMKS